MAELPMKQVMSLAMKAEVAGIVSVVLRLRLSFAIAGYWEIRLISWPTAIVPMHRLGAFEAIFGLADAL